MKVMDNYNGVAQLYRRIISPSILVKNEKCQKETHCRHTHYQRQSPVSRLKAASPVHSVVSAPGHLEANEASLEAINEDAVNNTAATKSEYAGYSFIPTVRFKTTSLPAMPLSRKYSPSPTGTTRSVPISHSHHMVHVTPSRFWANENPRILYSRQRDRIQTEEQAKSQCRRLKRTSEILKHRIDKQYYMSGTKIPIQGRYDVDNTDLLRLKLLSQNKQLVDYKTAKDMSSNPRESPSGQLSTPVPGSRGRKPSSEALSSGTENESRGRDGKWAEEDSETSSIDEFDSVSMKGRREEFQARKAAALAEGKSQQQGQHGASSEGQLTTPSNKAGGKKALADKTKESSSAKGARKGKIRFKEDGSKSAEKIGRKKVTKKGQEEEEKEEGTSETGEAKEEKRNKYLDEWLGIKREVEDTRYKPGKPPPNRIFLTASPEKADTKKTRNFSSTFLTEITESKSPEDEDEMTPDAKYGIINDKQKNVFGLLFDEVDKDKNGSVTLEELKIRMQPSVSKQDIKHFVQVFDLNKDKTVDKREFTAICALNDRIAGVKTESEDASLALDLESLAQHIVIFKEMFKTIDEDDDNRLDAGELLEMVSAAMETEIGADLHLAKEVLEGARDEYGFIDFIGFMSYIPFFAKLLKTILEHPLTIAELQRARERVRQHDLTFKPKKPVKEPKSWEVF